MSFTNYRIILQKNCRNRSYLWQNRSKKFLYSCDFVLKPHLNKPSNPSIKIFVHFLFVFPTATNEWFLSNNLLVSLNTWIGKDGHQTLVSGHPGRVAGVWGQRLGSSMVQLLVQDPWCSSCAVGLGGIRDLGQAFATSELHFRLRRNKTKSISYTVIYIKF